MAYKKPFQTLEVSFVNGGSLATDLSPTKIAPADWYTKDGFRRDLDCDVVREGWDHWRPNLAFTSSQQANTGKQGTVHAIAEINNPAGNTVVVAVIDNSVRTFSYDTGTWTERGTGYAAMTKWRWQIVQLNGVAFFNNGVDLPFYWRIGDATVTPLHQLRERGVASVGYLCEYNGFLMAGDVLEVNSSYMATLMNSGSPYGQVPVPATNTSRTQYRIVWSNATDGTDWAATVNASGTAATSTITLAWPMASFYIGLEITITGAGASGGNLVTTITVADALSTTIASLPVSATTALGSPVGYYDIQDDGARILAMVPLQNRLVVYRPNSIFVGTYTGNTDFPFQFERTYRGNRSVSLPYTIVSINGLYHLYKGQDFFYRYELGTLQPELDPVWLKCGRQFAANYVAEDVPYIYAAINGVTNEAFFVFRGITPLPAKVYCYDYNYSTVSRLILTADQLPIFGACATVHRPLAGNTADPHDLMFLMGDQSVLNGYVTWYGRTTRSLLTMLRYGVQWVATVMTGALDFGDAFNEKDIRSYFPLLGNFSFSTPPAIELKSYAFNNLNDPVNLITTNVITIQSGARVIVPLWQRGLYHQFKLNVTVAGEVDQLRLQGHLIEFDVVGTRSTTRLT